MQPENNQANETNTQLPNDDEKAIVRVTEEIIALQREFHFENKDKVTERRRRLRDIIDRATASGREA